MNGLIDHFYHKGKKYGYGTIVKFTDDSNKDVKYGRYNGVGRFFDKMETPEVEYTGHSKCTFADVGDIEEIIVPVFYRSIPDVKICKDTECNDMFYAWVLYIVAMLFISITNSRLIGWVSATIIFINYRHSKLYMKKKGGK